MNSSVSQSATVAGALALSPHGQLQGDAREREGWRMMQKAGASQTRKDGVDACDALYELAVKHGANDTAAAGFAHHVNGALALLEGQVHDGLRRESVMEGALAGSRPGAQETAAPPADLPRWSQRHAEELHEAIHFALSVHAESLSKKKRDTISTVVKRMLIDSQRDAASEASK